MADIAEILQSAENFLGGLGNVIDQGAGIFGRTRDVGEPPIRTISTPLGTTAVTGGTIPAGSTAQPTAAKAGVGLLIVGGIVLYLLLR